LIKANYNGEDENSKSIRGLIKYQSKKIENTLASDTKDKLLFVKNFEIYVKTRNLSQTR
jgi:hypothetical protein